MVTVKELEKQRIEKIKSLNSKQIANYVDVIVKDICKLHDVTAVDSDNYDEKSAEILNLYGKLHEIEDLTGDKFNNIRNYITSNLNIQLSIAETVIILKYINNGAVSRNAILSHHLKDIIVNYFDFDMYSYMLYQLMLDFNELSAVAPDKIAEMKPQYITTLQNAILKLKRDIEFDINVLDGAFYSDETIKNDIRDMKLSIKNYAESDDENDKLLVEFGVIEVVADLITAYEVHAEVKESYVQYKLRIDELFAAADNIFKKYSVEKYDAASGVAFDDFMKNEPKFNVETGELISP